MFPVLETPKNCSVNVYKPIVNVYNRLVNSHFADIRPPNIAGVLGTKKRMLCCRKQNLSSSNQSTMHGTNTPGLNMDGKTNIDPNPNREEIMMEGLSIYPFKPFKNHSDKIQKGRFEAVKVITSDDLARVLTAIDNSPPRIQGSDIEARILPIYKDG